MLWVMDEWQEAVMAEGGRCCDRCPGSSRQQFCARAPSPTKTTTAASYLGPSLSLWPKTKVKFDEAIDCTCWQIKTASKPQEPAAEQRASGQPGRNVIILSDRAKLTNCSPCFGPAVVSF